MIGRIIGNYKIQSKLGEGGMGAVYKGVDTMLDREVAIKALRPELASQTSVVERFRSEAVTLAKLHHPNIATLYSLFRQGDELYMVLEFVRGETLDSILTKRGALTSDEVIPVFCQILDGINHAHEYGIIHRDIKPANMMLTEKGTLKVLDFGIARLLGTNRMTRAGNIIGTLEYMAPEQVKGQETDARSDIYALGMMLYEVLTGRTPFDTENEFELMKLQIENLPPNPRSINPSISEAVEAAIMRAIQKNPDERFQTAGEFREALLDAGFASQGEMSRPSGFYQRAANGQPSSFPISNPGVESNPVISKSDSAPVSKDVIKETRLGQPVPAPATFSTDAIKETRLGEASLTNPDYYETESETEKSFLSNLTWIHYAGAAFAGTMLLGLLVLVPVFMFGGSDAPNTNELIKTDVNTSIANSEPILTTTPTSTPTPYISQPVFTEPVAPVVSTTPIFEPSEISTPEPVDSNENRAVKTRPVKTPTPTPRPTPKPVKARTPTPGGNQNRPLTREEQIRIARCRITGDC
jgi:serine/threonine protein kinase